MSHAEQIITFVLLDMTTLTQEYSMLLECQVRSNPATHRGVCGVSIYWPGKSGFGPNVGI